MKLLILFKNLTANCSDGQYWTLCLMTIMILGFGLACLFEYVELRQAQKKREQLQRKKKWLECALECELEKRGLL